MVLADFILEATTRIVMVKCVENRNVDVLRAAGQVEKGQYSPLVAGRDSRFFSVM